MKRKALLLTVLLLTACVSDSPTVADSMQLYSPDTLEISAGTTIQTKQGLYRAQIDERWYSADLYMKRVTEALNP
jgi:hypothetical protein